MERCDEVVRRSAHVSNLSVSNISNLFQPVFIIVSALDPFNGQVGKNSTIRTCCKPIRKVIVVPGRLVNIIV